MAISRHEDNIAAQDYQFLSQGEGMNTAQEQRTRDYAVLVRLSFREQQALTRLMEREDLPGATVLRRLLMRECRRNERRDG